MEIGTAEIIDELEDQKRRSRSMTSGNRPPGGGPHKNGGGSDGPNDDGYDDRDDFTAKKSKILTWFIMIVVLMTFGGLLSAYVVIATNNLDEWRPFALPVQLWISTIIIIASSVTYYLAAKATYGNDHPGAKRWFLITGALGIAFVISQIVSWIALSVRGMILVGNPYAGFFYMLTAVHALHIIGGLTALGSVLYRSWMPTSVAAVIERRKTLAQVVGWYWHFMGGIWIVLFIFLGFWK